VTVEGVSFESQGIEVTVMNRFCDELTVRLVGRAHGGIRHSKIRDEVALQRDDSKCIGDSKSEM
jgi:hypothetical protein